MKSQQEFLQLIDQHKGILYKVSKMYMEDEDDRNELIQEIVYQLWKSYNNFKGNSEFSTWMYRVSLNTALTFLKQEKRKAAHFTPLVHQDKADEIDTDIKEKQLELFYKAVHSLTKVEKALIFLFMEGQSHQQIGKNLGVSEGNARLKLSRTKIKLQEIIKKYGYEF